MLIAFDLVWFDWACRKYIISEHSPSRGKATTGPRVRMVTCTDAFSHSMVAGSGPDFLQRQPRRVSGARRGHLNERPPRSPLWISAKFRGETAGNDGF